MRNIPKLVALLLMAALILSGCSADRSAALHEESEVRDGTSEDTLATPSDFPASYDYGSGLADDWGNGQLSARLPEPEGNKTVLNTSPDLTQIQAIYLWEEGNVPAQTEVTRAQYDPVDFRPYLTAIPVREGTEVKGAVVLLAGGAFQVRANYTDTLPTAAHLRESGFQTFIVDYRLRPYTQQEGALDVACAVRYIRKNADIYGIDPDDLDLDYIPDELDEVSAHASAAGMIYSFYGRLSVASMDEEELRSGNLPPTFYCYGTEDPFYRQFEAQYDLMQDVGHCMIYKKRLIIQTNRSCVL